eukprot:4773934-Pyramimonas_sp.AAC.1
MVIRQEDVCKIINKNPRDAMAYLNSTQAEQKLQERDKRLTNTERFKQQLSAEIKREVRPQMTTDRSMYPLDRAVRLDSHARGRSRHTRMIASGNIEHRCCW